MGHALLTLRHNIAIENDVSLAEEELRAICQPAAPAITRLRSSAEMKAWLGKHMATEEAAAYRFLMNTPKRKGVTALAMADLDFSGFQAIIRRAAFVQEGILAQDSGGSSLEPSLRRLVRLRSVSRGLVAFGVPLATVLEYSALLVTRRDHLGSITAALAVLLEMLLDDSPPPSPLVNHLRDALRAKKTTLYLSHELHLYKGKFFPRLVHGLINRFAEPGGHAVVCDPFAGSGTALLEASLLGFDSIGLDVDPTAVLISQQKTALDLPDLSELVKACSSIQGAVAEQPATLFEAPSPYSPVPLPEHHVQVPEPMRSRLAKRGAEEGYDLLGEIEADSAVALRLISQAPQRLRSLFRVCLSHALPKKIRLRFVGIGNGRFTFDVAKVRVLDLFVQKTHHMLAIAEVFAFVRQLGIGIGRVDVHQRSALDLGSVCGPGSIDLIVTSPPYIPSSSGREHYARARSIPLVLTGAATTYDLDEIAKLFVGEMSGAPGPDDGANLPSSITRTLSFLQHDEQRRPKYLPTLRYYLDLRLVLEQILRVLSPSGVALFVVAKSHTFYIHKTKEILHNVDAVNAIADLGRHVGLDPIEIIPVPLLKSGGLNARPRSSDSYAEAVVVFKKAHTETSPHLLSGRDLSMREALMGS